MASSRLGHLYNAGRVLWVYPSPSCGWVGNVYMLKNETTITYFLNIREI